MKLDFILSMVDVVMSILKNHVTGNVGGVLTSITVLKSMVLSGEAAVRAQAGLPIDESLVGQSIAPAGRE